MEQYHEIVMRESIDQDKETRQLAMSIRDTLNAQRQAAHDPASGPAPAALNHKDPEVMQAVYWELRDSGAAHPSIVSKYDKKAKQYEANT
jgi:hypothetical protein